MSNSKQTGEPIPGTIKEELTLTMLGAAVARIWGCHPEFFAEPNQLSAEHIQQFSRKETD